MFYTFTIIVYFNLYAIIVGPLPLSVFMNKGTTSLLTCNF